MEQFRAIAMKHMGGKQVLRNPDKFGDAQIEPAGRTQQLPNAPVNKSFHWCKHQLRHCDVILSHKISWRLLS